jgi:hypothetical protein
MLCTGVAYSMHPWAYLAPGGEWVTFWSGMRPARFPNAPVQRVQVYPFPYVPYSIGKSAYCVKGECYQEKCFFMRISGTLYAGK